VGIADGPVDNVAEEGVAIRITTQVNIENFGEEYDISWYSKSRYPSDP
jgi:hypothetical protein